MATLPPDPYKTLGVSKDAQIPEIRSAHRKLVLKCHPDKVQDPTLKAQKANEFQKVQQAYELLSDENERQKYDDQVHLAELREQMRSKANTSAPRTTAARYPAAEYEVRTAEPRSSPFKSQSTPMHATFSRSWEDETSRGTRMFGAEIRLPRQSSYTDRPKRDVEKEREREREREIRERERERDLRERERGEREARAREKESRRAREKEDAIRREARHADKKKLKESQRKDEKKGRSKPYIEPLDEESPVKDRKKSSKKHEEKRERDRSPIREEAPASDAGVQTGRSWEGQFDYASNYIHRSKHRAAAFAQPPAAPTPPPASGESPFPPPGPPGPPGPRPRRGSVENPRVQAYRTPSREVVDDPSVAEPSASARQFKSPAMGSSPPRRDLPRTNTLPAEAASFPRPVPGITRSRTFDGKYPEAPVDRGRYRSKMHNQISEEDDSEEEARRRRHRNKKGSPPESQNIRRYQVENHQTKPVAEFPRASPAVSYAYRPAATERPSIPHRDTYSYGTKVQTSKTYGNDDINYSSFPPAPYPRDNGYAAY